MAQTYKGNPLYYLDPGSNRYRRVSPQTKPELVDSPPSATYIPSLKTMSHKTMSKVIVDAVGGDVDKSLSLATYAHEGMYRKQLRFGTKDPYIVHPMRNALRATVWTRGHWDEDKVRNLAHACLLHDVVEDAPDRVQDFYDDRADPVDILGERFNYDVADAVAAVTNPEYPAGISKEGKRQAYLEHIKEALPGNDMAILVKCSDLWDNAGSACLSEDQGMRRHLVKKYAPVVAVMMDMADTLEPKELARDVRQRMKILHDKLQRAQ